MVWSWDGIFISGKIIVFTNKLIIVEHVQFFACGKLFSADQAGETVQMEHFVSCFPYQVTRWYSLTTATTFSAVSPVKKKYDGIIVVG